MGEVDLLIKLFDTLRDSMRDTQKMSQAMLANQTNIGNYVKNLPMDEVKELLKDHKKESSDDIGTCTETVELQTETILKKVNLIDNKISRMILVVIVAFSLLSVAYFFGRYTTDNTKNFDAWEQKIEKQQGDEHTKLRKEIIDTIRDEMNKQKP